MNKKDNDFIDGLPQEVINRTVISLLVDIKRIMMLCAALAVFVFIKLAIIVVVVIDIAKELWRF